MRVSDESEVCSTLQTRPITPQTAILDRSATSQITLRTLHMAERVSSTVQQH